MKSFPEGSSPSSRRPSCPPLGLVLAGGHSRRMGENKGGLAYTESGRSQAERCFELLSEVCSRVYLSVRPRQARFYEGDRLPRIRDRWEDKGPLGGIVSAVQQAPERAWLVLACDKPFVNTALLQTLVTHRASSQDAVAYRISAGRAPDPLCAVYESDLLPQAISFLHQDRLSPRALLEEVDTRVLKTEEEWRLMDVNRPEDYRAAKQLIQSHPQILDADG